MSRLTGNEVRGLMEAYQAVYTPQELTEEQVWEEVEEWVNALVEEGYDLSDYTWEEMYEAYLSEDVKKDSEGAGGAFRRWVGARATELGDIVGSGYKGIIGKETSSSNPLARTSNALARGGTTPVRDVIAPFVVGAIKNTKSEPKASKAPDIAKPTPSNQPQPDFGGKLGNLILPPRGSSKAADPVVRSGGSYGFFGAIKPPEVAKPTPPSQPALNGVKRGPRGGVILNQVEVDCDLHIVEAEAQVAPITGSAGKEWMQKSKDGKWYPITDLELAKKSKQRWEDQKRDRQIDADVKAGKRVNPTEYNPSGDPRLANTNVPGREKALAHWTRSSNIEPASTTQPPASTTPPASKTRPAPKPLETRMSSVTGKREFVGTTAGGTKFERRAATGAELRAAQAARKAALVSKPEDKEGAEKSAVKAGVETSKPASKPAVTSRPSGFGVPTAPLAAKLSAATSTAPPTPTAVPKASPPPPKKETDSKPVRLPVVSYKDSYEYDAYDLVLEYLLSQGHAGTLEEANYVMLEMDAEMIGDIVEVMGQVQSVIQSPPKKDPKPSKDKKVPQETGVTGDGKGKPMDY